MNVLGELQKRGWQVIMCPGKIEIVSPIEKRHEAMRDGVTVWEQVDDAIRDVVSDHVQREVAAIRANEEERLRELGRYRGYNDA